MIKSKKPVVAITAMRTGAGKSPTTRYVSKTLKSMGFKVGIIRHPMPYGDLVKQKVQKFTTLGDLDRYEVTIEEREDYEPHIINGFTVYSGVDYEEILHLAEAENDILIWDGGNNDYPFIKPDLYICVVDPYRWEHIDTYYPGETNVRAADIVIISKVNTAPKELVEKAEKKVREINEKAKIIPISIKYFPDRIVNLQDKKVAIVEDGPTVTHGEMGFGAAYLYAKEKGANIINPRPYFKGTIKDTVSKYPHLKEVIPALGYSKKQIQELEELLNELDVDYIISATPTRLANILKINKPIIQITYEVEDFTGELKEELIQFTKKINILT